jgi:deazaflavin-dependent oxidoreductase (nitroreductase family)
LRVTGGLFSVDMCALSVSQVGHDGRTLVERPDRPGTIRGVSKAYRRSPGRRALNAVVRPLARLGLTGPRTHLLTVPGRRTGRLWSTPVSLVELDGERYLVAPYGERNWVKNARAAGRVELRRGRRRERPGLEEASGEQAVRVLRRYYVRTRFTRRFFDVDLDAPEERWAAEASRHPVFRLRP